MIAQALPAPVSTLPGALWTLLMLVTFWFQNALLKISYNLVTGTVSYVILERFRRNTVSGFRFSMFTAKASAIQQFPLTFAGCEGGWPACRLGISDFGSLPAESRWLLYC